ncbi:type I polyketide synthase, partial [Actinokineospora pegani]|uniref:type I polyketide synthase n=1 Tax=Actinokineospora pegani TaxID=2654637 RepID=UPI0022A6AB48
FSGQGSQRIGMGRELAERFPVFAEAFDDVVSRFDGLREALGSDAISRTEHSQAGLFAFEVALVRLLESWGVRPDVLIGHSIGELAAAHVAGVWSLADAVKVVSARGRLMGALPEGGAMVSIKAAESEIELTPGVSIAAVNGPESVVVSGVESEVLAIAAEFDKTKRLSVSHAFHSPLMDPMLEEFRAVVESVEFHEPSIPLVAGRVTDPGYWVEHVRGTVRFADGVAELGAVRAVEIGPDAVLSSLVDGCVPALRGGRGEAETVLSALGKLIATGADADLAPLFPGARIVALPTYAFQHKRYWIESTFHTTDPVDAWRYRVDWVPVTPSPRDPGHWLVVTTTPADDVLAALTPAQVTVCAPDALVPGDYTGVLSLLAADETPLPGHPDVPTGLDATVALLRDLAGIAAPLWVLTRGAVPADGPVTHPVQAGVWGLGRVAALEHPDRWGGLVDWTGGDLLAALGGDEDQVAVSESGVRARRLVHAPTAPGEPWTPSGTVLITGGTGALGAEVARWARGADKLVLTSRRGLDAPGAAELAEELGARIVPCDVSDRDALAALIAEHRPNAVVHTAGVVADGVLEGMDADALAAVLAAKATATAHLDELTRDLDLDAFVVFTSFAGVLGGVGQGNYAAANAIADAVVDRRRAAGLPATAIAWGAWAGGGMAEGLGARLADAGFVPMAPSVAVTALATPGSHAVVDLDWTRFLAAFSGGVPTPFLADLPEARDLAPAERTWRDDLAAAPVQRRRRIVDDLVRGAVAAVLGHGEADGDDAVEAGRPFKELGFDSLTAVELRDRLGAATGLPLPVTLVYDYPTPADLAAWLVGEVAGQAGAEAAPRAGDADAPIAVVAMACRFPGGVAGPEDLWALLSAGGDGIGAFPDDRGWDLAALHDPDRARVGTSYVREGGFVDGADRFDAELFGISPREAVAMDPQQRLLLEACWEAVERAGIDVTGLRGSQTGVFAGTNGQDYTALLREVPEGLEGYLGTGTTASVLSGRVAYTLGLEGPAVTVDTACSASLVAMHWAAQALRSGECTLALAGGVTVMSSPTAFIEFSRQRGLAADGRCKAFSDDADGTGWGEGVGVLLLERLSDAQRNGHPVLAVLRGSAVNQDGASNGLTAPNGPSQQRVIRAALAAAGLGPSDVDAVEAHGTGTSLGDPIEAQALLAAYGQDRDEPLYLGSVKSNIGHTQAAAGVAGVMKMVLALRHGVLPQTLHVGEPSSHVDWSAGSVELLDEPRDWPPVDRPRRAGVSAFGISGTNAHVILEQAPEPEPVDAPAVDVPAVDAVVPWVLSGKTEAAVRAQAARLLSLAPDVRPVDVGWSLATGRAGLEHRAAVVAADTAGLRAGLAALADGSPGVGVVAGRAVDARTAFVFSGQGSQWADMGAGLRRFPVFAAAFDEVLSHFDAGLRERIGTEDVHRTEVTQPALFAFQVALVRLFASWGVRPEVLIGHSIGELAAAHVAGVWSLADACEVVAARGRLMGALPEGGAMVSIKAAESEIELTPGVGVAAVNGPESVVISGVESEVLAIAARFDKTKRLTVSHAFHSPLMDPMLNDFRAVLDAVEFHEPSVPIVAGRVTDPEYWVEHVRGTVRFAEGVAEMGAVRAVEIGPDAVLSSLVDGCVPVLRRGRPEAETAVAALASLVVRGGTADWAAVFPGGRRIDLPTYAFQRQSFWLEVTPAPAAGDSGLWAALDSGALADELAADADRTAVDAVLPLLTGWRRRRTEQSEVDSLAYTVAWNALTAGDSTLAGTWLVVVPEGVDTEVPAILAAAGADVVTAAPGALPELGDVAGVVSLCALDESGDVVPKGLVDTWELLRAGIAAPVWALTRGAVAIGPADRPDSPRQALVWGLGRVAALEHGDRWGGLVDLPATWDDRARARFTAVLGGGEDQVAVRASGVYARRLVRTTVGARTWRPRGTVLITGGTGGLGAKVARWAKDNGADRLVLTSRRGLDSPGAADLAAELGAEVVACDAADRDALARVLDGIDDLRAVVHAAGVVADGPIADLTEAEVAALLDGKVRGAANLDELTGELDAFVVFSSIAGVWGSGGQAAYAAANAYLDALVLDRRARGLAGTALAWGPWAEGGMAHDAAAEHLRKRGLTLLRPEVALTALGRAVGGQAAAVTVADVDWSAFAPTFTLSRPSPLLDGVPEVRDALAEPVVGTGAPDRFAGLARADRDAAVLDLVRTQVATVLGHPDTAAVEPGRAFSDLGFDSLTAVELRNGLAAATGHRLPATLVFDHPTPSALAAALAAALFGDDDRDPVLAELDRLEALLAAPADPLRGEVTARLHTLLARWSSAEPEPDRPAVAERLSASSAAELFDFIDNELG